MSVTTQYSARRCCGDADGQLRSTSTCLQIYVSSMLVEYQLPQQESLIFSRRRYDADPAGTARITYWNTFASATA